MKQVLQNLKTGQVTIPEIPTPKCKKGFMLVKTSKSLISLGTEKMLLNFGKSNWINKAKSQPDKVKQVLEKVKTDGLKPTVAAVQSKLDTPLPLGYSNVGTVVEVGQGVTGFKVGDRVVSNGNHAEFVVVPTNLCAKIPDQVLDEEAAFTVVSSIGLQGVRLIKPEIGETFVVMGLGLIGLITVQILKANGCHVIGFDLDGKKVELAKSYGIDAFRIEDKIDPIKKVLNCTDGVGADGVIITASTMSNDPIEQSPRMCRKRGRVILVGVSSLNISRADFYEKEISFQVSCSYGPGRYEENYESKGMDYPIGFVRWTENRNFQAVLKLMERGALSVRELISVSVPIIELPEFYENINDHKDLLGTIVDYPRDCINEKFIKVNDNKILKTSSDSLCIAVIGAGGYASSTLLPVLSKYSQRIKYIASGGGVSSNYLAQKFNIEYSTTDTEVIFNDDEVNCVFVLTRHNNHSALAIKALSRGKHVYLEKPLAIEMNQLNELTEFIDKNEKLPHLMVGYNRRYSPFISTIRDKINSINNPISIIYTVNAGAIDHDHWTQSLDIGGGRLVGEGCHFVDLIIHLVNSRVLNKTIVYMDSKSRDTFSLSLKFENGSIGVLNYFSNGNKAVSKERLEIFSDGKYLFLDNFKSISSAGFGKIAKVKTRSQDKGHYLSVKKFLESINDDKPLIKSEELISTARICIELRDEC